MEKLRDIAPEEANVVFQLVRVYRALGEDTKAAQMLAVARDMSPKSLHKIRRLLHDDKEEGDLSGVGGESMEEG